MSDNYVEYLEERLAPLQGVEFRTVAPGQAEMDGLIGGRAVRLAVKRDLDPAPVGDVEFIAHALADMRLLVDALRSGVLPTVEDLRAVEWRIQGASSGCWIAQLERDHVGGCDVISVNDRHDPRDLYLYVDGAPAPSWLFDALAKARQDLPCLVQWVQDLRRRG